MISKLKKIIEFIAWLNICIAVAAIFVFSGYLIYSACPLFLYKILAGAIAFIGIALGIYTAERTRKSIGCSTLIFRGKSSPDLNNINDNTN